MQGEEYAGRQKGRRRSRNLEERNKVKCRSSKLQIHVQSEEHLGTCHLCNYLCVRGDGEIWEMLVGVSVLSGTVT